MRKEGVVYYLHSDHLSSTSLTTCGSQDGCDGTPHQGVVARQLYHPYGEVRWSEGTLPTDYGFTGQRLEAGLGLMHYGARFYSLRLGRFVSADSILPEPGEPQALNRYSYVLDNPLRYTDPTGHYEFEEDPDDPYVWWHDKPANNWIRSAEPVDFPEEFHQPTDAEFAAVVTLPFWAPALALGLETLATDLWEAGSIAYETATWWATEKLIKAGLLGGGGAKAAADYACADGNCTNEVEQVAEGEFSIVDWSNYPNNPQVPKPQGTFRILEGAEYQAARAQANAANRAMHQTDPTLRGLQIHEIKPVKFSGSPTDPANKVVLTPSGHLPFTKWWNALHRALTSQ
jgi:RHS repeat-associated protein